MLNVLAVVHVQYVFRVRMVLQSIWRVSGQVLTWEKKAARKKDPLESLLRLGGDISVSFQNPPFLMDLDEIENWLAMKDYLRSTNYLEFRRVIE